MSAFEPIKINAKSKVHHTSYVRMAIKRAKPDPKPVTPPTLVKAKTK